MAKERIGIMGGSFNPIHERHVEIASCALREANLSRVIFIPTGNPPHKRTGLEDAVQRLRMTALAIVGEPRFSASDIEICRSGIIYTVDTLQLLRKQLPNAEFFYLIGEDTLYDLVNWHQPDKVMTLCTFLVCPRRTALDADAPACAALAARGAKLQFLPLPPRDISASAIRGALSHAESHEALAPQVDEYIRVMGLYGVTPAPPDARDTLTRLYGLLNIRRLAHSLLVTRTARELAALHGVDAARAAWAGLLHDCAKDLSLSRMQALARAYKPAPDKRAMQNGNLLHGPAGAVLARRMFGVTDEEVLGAIACHTTARAEMTPLEMIVFLADKIEPSRKPYPALAEIRAAARVDLKRAVAMSLQSTAVHLKRLGVEPAAPANRTSV